MANELQYQGTTAQTGLTVVAKVYDSSGTQVGGNVSCSEVGVTAIYLGNMPAISAGSYLVKFFNGTTLLGYGQIYWDGSYEIDLLSLDSLVASRLAAASYVAPDNAGISANGVAIAGVAAKTNNLPADPASDTTVNTRLAASAYTAPDNASITGIKAKTDLLPADPASDTTVNTRLAAAAYTPPPGANIIAQAVEAALTDEGSEIPDIQAKLDSLILYTEGLPETTSSTLRKLDRYLKVQFQLK